MNKTAYMNALRQALDGLPASVIEDTMWEYERKFVDAMVAGKSEEEIAAGLPKPELLAAQKKTSMRYQALKTNFSLGNVAGLLVALIGLMIFNLFMLIPAVAYFSLLCSAYIVAMVMYVAGIGITAASISGVEQFNFDIPVGRHHVHNHNDNHRIRNHNVRVDVTETGILIDGEKQDEHGQAAASLPAAPVTASVASATSTTSATSVASATASASAASATVVTRTVSTESQTEKLHVELGNHFSGTKLFSGLGLLLASIALMMLSMFMTKYTFIGFKHYLRWNLSQLQLGHAA
ncbi:DUF1700 domain-containing protein [Undibacterium sp. TC4M20W]|uniref:DUF1700 domain-containing protein n=1 Tax=unclassified Undibacterium TaxID=2630295 RepID=UPI003BF2CF72